jgi:hypothetical protein
MMLLVVISQTIITPSFTRPIRQPCFLPLLFFDYMGFGISDCTLVRKKKLAQLSSQTFSRSKYSQQFEEV